MAFSPHASDGSSSAPMAFSPHASDGSSSAPMASSPHASDGSSSAPLPSFLIDVSSVEDVRQTLDYADPQVQLKFMLTPDMSLAEAHKLWKLVSAEGGGHSIVKNPDRLVNKEEALHCVRRRLERLRRWRSQLDRKHKKVVVEVSKLERLIDAGGPGLLPGYQPHRYDGPDTYIDLEQEVGKEELRGHIEAIRAILLNRSPGSPATDGDVRSVKNCEDDEAAEQLDISCFNLAYLEVKAKGLELLSGHLGGAIADLEEKFINKPTHLGAGDADFVGFIEVPMYQHEAPPPDWSHNC